MCVQWRRSNMACYAALVSFLQTLDQIPQPVHQIISLQDKISSLLGILEDSSQKSSLIVNHLEGQIRDASYEAQDIIERSIELQGLEKIMDRFDSILEALSKIKDDWKVKDVKPRDSWTSISNESTLVGLDDDLIQIKDQLTGSPSQLDIISIVGMGGIGKTTLARNLYEDVLVTQRFDTRAWIVVSQEYLVKEMFMGLLDSTGYGVGHALYGKSIEQLAELLYKSLKGRRYLIVMDDVWDTEAWDEVRRFFPNDNNGSRVILTTRLSGVAIYANSNSSIHQMSLLNSEASWNLLQDKVFKKERCPVALENTGRKIAQNCKGLPLAIVVIGGLLSKGNRTQDVWEYIAENANSVVTGSDDQIMKILSLSYNFLPCHLKACFLYMGIFPEDFEISVFQLIKLWIAEGFVKPLAHKSFEEVAEDYLKDLIDRSLIMVHKINLTDEIETCIIHDVLRELCVIKAQEEKFLQVMNRDTHLFPEGGNNQYRVSIHFSSSNYLQDCRDSSIRSLLYFSWSWSDCQLLSLVMSSRLLRVLDLVKMELDGFPIEIVELVHLRYLALAVRGETLFPASISKLQNLQTLLVYGGYGERAYIELPLTIWEMTKLRHLCIFGECFLPYPFHEQEDYVLLKNLQTLSEVVGFRWTRKVFEIMPNLQELRISFFHVSDTEWSSYEFNNLIYLSQLEVLECCFFDRKPLPGNLAFPPSLRKLTLRGSRISWDKISIVGSLPNLLVLELDYNAFQGPVWEPNEGEFTKLKSLLINNCWLEHWRANDTHFPSLERLFITNCRKLVEIPSEIGEIPTLKLLELDSCSTSAVASARLIEREQRCLENNCLRVHIRQ